LEIGNWKYEMEKYEIGNTKWRNGEIRNWKYEIGNTKLEIRNGEMEKLEIRN
jgi:hypothetical protein